MKKLFCQNRAAIIKSTCRHIPFSLHVLQYTSVSMLVCIQTKQKNPRRTMGRCLCEIQAYSKLVEVHASFMFYASRHFYACRLVFERNFIVEKVCLHSSMLIFYRKFSHVKWFAQNFNRRIRCRIWFSTQTTCYAMKCESLLAHRIYMMMGFG